MSDDEKNEGCKIFVSCKRATELSSKSLETSLSRRERFALKFHLLICAWCRRYENQIAILRAAIRCKIAHDEKSGPALSPEARERIRSALKQ